MPARLPIFIFFLLFACFLRVTAQTGTNLVSSDTAASATIQQYTSSQGEKLLLYNGVEYAHSYPHTTGHPFFLTDTFQRSSLVYDGVLYSNVSLAYDIVNSEVVIKNKDSFLIQLVSEKVDSFLFKNHVFLTITRGSLPQTGLPEPGIYEAYLYADSVAVFIRHQKFLIQAGNAADPDRFRSVDDYFIRVNGKSYEVDNNAALLTAFGNRKEEMKSYLRQHRVNVKKHREGILAAAEYYTQVNK